MAESDQRCNYLAHASHIAAFQAADAGDWPQAFQRLWEMLLLGRPYMMARSFAMLTYKLERKTLHQAMVN